MAEWVVDGDDVVGSRPDGWWRDRAGAKRRLVERLERFAAARDAADDDIAALVGRHPDPGSLTVVTSDRELARRVHDDGAAVVGAGTLLAELDTL